PQRWRSLRRSVVDWCRMAPAVIVRPSSTSSGPTRGTFLPRWPSIAVPGPLCTRSDPLRGIRGSQAREGSAGPGGPAEAGSVKVQVGAPAPGRSAPWAAGRWASEPDRTPTEAWWARRGGSPARLVRARGPRRAPSAGTLAASTGPALEPVRPVSGRVAPRVEARGPSGGQAWVRREPRPLEPGWRAAERARRAARDLPCLPLRGPRPRAAAPPLRGCPPERSVARRRDPRSGRAPAGPARAAPRSLAG